MGAGQDKSQEAAAVLRRRLEEFGGSSRPDDQPSDPSEHRLSFPAAALSPVVVRSLDVEPFEQVRIDIGASDSVEVLVNGDGLEFVLRRVRDRELADRLAVARIHGDLDAWVDVAVEAIVAQETS